MNRIVECIPNFSEGVDESKIELIAKAIASVKDVAVLNRHLDADHNRSVVTFAGSPEGVVEAAFRAAETAVEVIDLNMHLGEHPRIGAMDVLPFVPIRGVTMDDCVLLARRTGERIAYELNVPIYLYERAATRPDREDLANVRRGEFEVLRREIEENPDRMPDFGEPRLHPTAGAMAVGARAPLIACNVNLATEDISIAARIARAVRGSSGGLQFVKAIPIELRKRRQAQVSMNLIDYESTPLFRAFEMVKREAERYGVAVAGTEIVGLAPQAALDACGEFYLRIENFHENLVLENRLRAELDERLQPAAALAPPPLIEVIEAPFAPPPEAFNLPEQKEEEEEPAREAPVEAIATPIATFADVITSGAQTPDGASIAAYAGALGASLGAMICQLTMGQKPASQREARSTLEQLDQLRADLHRAINEDAETREMVLDAISLSDETEGEQLARTIAIEEAHKNAVAIPLRVAENSIEVLELLGDLTEIGNPSALADLASAAQMAMTAMRGAAYNVFATLLSINDDEFNRARRFQITDLVTRGQQVTDQIESLFFRLYPR
jgi:glutamate formiminotransferase/formiminotetrahydrofolate cyclodeaminase